MRDSSRLFASAATKLLLSLFLYNILTGLAGNSILLGQNKYKETTVTNGGDIRGTVIFTGDVSTAMRMEVTQDKKTCGKMKSSSCFSVGKKLGVANAFVYVNGITEGKPVERKPVYSLLQERCEYIPHAMIIPVGERLEIVNNDPILHNVHTYLDGKPPKTLFNIAQPMKGIRSKPKPMEKPGLVLATCDAGHPWMFAHIMVAEHPYYAVTDANGNFKIENVPPGDYMLQFWHEGITITNKNAGQGGKVSKYEFEPPYEESRQITVTSQKETIADFELRLR